MERRFRVRLEELLADTELAPSFMRGLLPNLKEFLQPFIQRLLSEEQRQNAQHYIEGLISNLKGKNVEAIAYLHDQERQALQKFIGQSPWDHKPLLNELAERIAQALAEVDGVLVFDPSAFPKKGTESVGVQRQWCGRLGKVENCQVGIYLGYVSRKEHALVDVRLYLPKKWVKLKSRLKKAGVPQGTPFRTRHELILEMLDERGKMLPHQWISGDDELGRCGWFRQELQQREETYLLAVPSNTAIRDLTVKPPPHCGIGAPVKVPFCRVDRWCARLPESAWETLEVRDAEKGPLVVQMAKTLVQARTEGKVSRSVEQLVVFRERQADGTYKHDYLLSNAVLSVSIDEFARVFKAQHRIEECLRRAKSEAGLGSYQVRTWEGWHHHQCLSLLATWFLTQETLRGKKVDPRVDSSAGSGTDRWVAAQDLEVLSFELSPTQCESPFAPKRGGSVLPL